MAIEIRVCQKSDVAALDWSAEQIYREHFANQFARQEAGDATVFIALQGNYVVGRIIADVEFGESDEVWVLGLEVRSTHRRLGIASSLMQTVEKLARQREAVRIRLNVAKTNAGAQKLYERLGYCQVGKDLSPGLKDRQGNYLAKPEPRWILERKLT